MRVNVAVAGGVSGAEAAMRRDDDVKEAAARRFTAEVFKVAKGWKIPIKNVLAVQKTFNWGQELGLAFAVFAPSYLHEEILETYSHPESWWDALKAASPVLRCLGLRPKMKTVKILTRLHRMCPHLEVDEQRRHLTWMASGD